MSKKIILSAFVLLICITMNLSVYAKSNLPITKDTGKWALELSKSDIPSHQPDKFNSYKLTITNLNHETLDISLELYRPDRDRKQEMIILMDPTRYRIKSYETVTFINFNIANYAKEMEVVINWTDKNNRKHKQNVVFTNIQY
ncbi:hypothetical protein J2T12_002514 [Paenibacillus anaericanus]|uniref:hypothetical protein n=1 Tax=Paenibacillus anaericanus TaxID=170367 RepID=UPI00278801DA|nr:hypothetical protein [Paenibacillus anaericanus]MDQ0089104.1 hypothetical protein [Paenibacillus anaericanus]